MTWTYDDSSDLLNTTEKARVLDRAAYDLGLGNIDDLISAGLQPKTNAAQKALDAILGKKDKDKNFTELLHMQLLRTLDAINQELDWLHEQIGIEQAAIGENLDDLDFIATLDEDNIMGADGELRDDVKALLAKHGYENADDMDVADIMLILKQIETDVVADTTMRQGRIDAYKKRADHLDTIKQDIRKYVSPDASPQMLEEIERGIDRQPQNGNWRLSVEVAAIDEDILDRAETVEAEQNFGIESSGFSMNPVG